ncbi:MAG: hypothetical protein WC836_09875 [Desulfobacula sp.]|jgi:hypothetical protein
MMMKKSLISILVLWFMAGIAQANPASQALVTTGRTALFNNGTPTCSGIIAANGHFKAAVQADPADQTANLFYALTRLVVPGLEKDRDRGLKPFWTYSRPLASPGRKMTT